MPSQTRAIAKKGFAAAEVAEENQVMDEAQVDRATDGSSSSELVSRRTLWIGTSGFMYRHWRGGVFYPKGLRQKEELEYFASSFPTVELNNPFYRLPPRETFEAWRERTPDDFLFAVKASRFITHVKRMRNCEEPVARLMESISGLGRKLGPILFQLPPSARLDLVRLENFLELLPRGPLWVFEFRQAEWFVDPAYDVLRRHAVALCLPVGGRMPDPPDVVTAEFAYVRMHSGRGEYGNFTSRQLQAWAERIGNLASRGLRVFVYFNNDAAGCAIRNAFKLRDLLGLER